MQHGQHCPIARGAEIFAERWTPLIIRNLYLAAETSARSWKAHQRYAAFYSGSSSSNGSVSSRRALKPDGRGHHYELTSAGHDLFKVCQSLGEWGARWLEIAPENLDPFVALWSMCHALRRDRLPIAASSFASTLRVVRHVSAIGFGSSWRHRDLQDESRRR